MKILKVSFKGRELSRVQLVSPSILIGRSPFCDLVLRMKGVNPVQYIVEWVGVGEFDPQSGKWAVFVNHSDQAADEIIKSQSYGEGLLLSQKPIHIDGFDFEIFEDHFSEAHIEKGKIKSQFLESQYKLGIRKNVLEVVSVFNDSESISQVYHFNTLSEPQFVVPDLSLIRVSSAEAPQGTVAKINISQLTGAKVFSKGQLVKDNGALKGELTLEANDLLQVRWKLKDYYFRFVPSVPIEPVKFKLEHHKFGLTAAAITIIGLLLFSFVKLPEFKPEVPLKPPPRIAKVEVKEMLPPPPAVVKEEPPPPPVIKEEPPKEQMVDVKNKPESKSAPKEIQSAKPQFAQPTKNAPKVALDSPAPKDKTPSVGLLGMLKNKKAATISADQVINQGVITKNVEGEKSQFVIQQSPSGIVSNRPISKPTGTLTGAASSKEFKDTGNGSMPISVAKGSADGIGDLSGFGKAKGGSDNTGFSSGESVEGGLDRESVRRVINAYKKEIRSCYEKALTSKSRLNGRILYRWGITPAGDVSYVNMLKSEVGSVNLEECVLAVIKSMKFPKATNKQPTVVIYPYVFQTKN